MPHGRRALAFVPSALCIAAGSLEAQNGGLPRRDNPVVFLEKAYFSPLAPFGNGYLFEGQPSAHYFFTNGLNSRTWTRDGGWRWALSVSSTFLVRMVRTTSEPVRTPSYQIRPLLVQRVYTPGMDARDPAAFRLFGLGAAFTHYSNGQSGCTFRGFERDTTVRGAPCRAVDPALAARHVANEVDGDFSTSFLSLALHWRTGRLRLVPEEAVGVVRHQQTFGIEFQAHPINIRPGGMNGPQSLDYGQHQVGVSYEAERRYFPGPGPAASDSTFSGVARVAVTGAHRFAREGGRSRSFGSVEVSYLFDRARAFGVFARVTQGSDYYNIRYQDVGTLVLAGAMWDVGRLDVYRR